MWQAFKKADPAVKAAIIGGIFLLIGAIITGTFQLIKPQTGLTSPTSSPTPVVTSTPGSAQTTAAASPTSTVVIEKRTIPCAQSSCQVMIVLDSVGIDYSNGNMLWTFALGSSPGCTATLGLYLEDPSGTQYRVGGQAAEQFTLAPGGSIHLVAIFALLPTHGVAYQLHIGGGAFPGFECITGPSYGGEIYQTESFTF